MRKTARVFVIVLAVLGFAALGQFAYSQANPGAATNPASVQITKGPVIEEVTNNKAIIAWSTNVPSSSVIRYGTDANNLSQTAEAGYSGLTHRVTINNLNPSTKYFFAVDSGQGQGTGTEAKSQTESFTTVAPGAQPEKYPKPGPGK